MDIEFRIEIIGYQNSIVTIRNFVENFIILSSMYAIKYLSDLVPNMTLFKKNWSLVIVF